MSVLSEDVKLVYKLIVVDNEYYINTSEVYQLACV